MLSSQKREHLKAKVRMWEDTFMSENHYEEGNQGGNQDNIGKVHLEGEHFKLKERGKKGDIAIEKIPAIARDCKSSLAGSNAVTITNNDSTEELDF